MLTSIYRFRLAICGAVAFGVLVSLSGNAAEDLPPDLKQELRDLEAQMASVESRIDRLAYDKIEQSVRELELWVDEFCLDAELLDDDPLLARLTKQIQELGEKARKAAEDRKANMNKMDAPKRERVDIDKMLKINVDLKNVSFRRDVAPIIADVCMRCHNPQRSSGDFDASTFTSFTSMIEPGDPENSHILNLVTGKAEPRMPRGGQTVFTREWTDIWTAWIEQGAKFDGNSKSAPITDYMIDLDTQRRQLLASMSTEELETIHLAEAERHIDIVGPKKEVHTYLSPNVIVNTTLNESDAEYIAWLTEAVFEELRLTLGQGDKPVFRGRFGMNVFGDRVDYLAFAQQVDGFSPEGNQYGHVRIRPEYQYAALTADQPNYELDGLVAHQAAAAFLEQLGRRRLPPWAVYGYARRIAAGMEGRHKSREFRDELARGAELAWNGKSLEYVFGETYAWVESAPMSVSFFEFMMKNDKKRAAAFVNALADSGNVSGALNQAFGNNSAQAAQSWAQWAASMRR